MDLFIIRGIVRELQGSIAGAFITKIYQMNRTDLLLRLRGHGEEKQLLISTHPDFHRLHLSEKKYANPLVPPRFCAYLRKHVQGGRIAGVSQDPYERVVRLRLQKKLDAGIIQDLVLVAEMVGKGSNLLLLQEEKILDCLHFRKEAEASRPAAPGLAYVPPAAAGKWRLDEVGPEHIQEIFPSPSGGRWKVLVEKIAGLSPLLAREVEFQGRASPTAMWEAFRLLRERYERAEFAPRIYTLLGEKKILAPLALTSLESAAQEVFPSLNEAADAFYFQTVAKRQIFERKQAMVRRIKQLLSRLERRRENLLKDREKLREELEFKDYGEILAANYPRMKKGMKEVEALDFRQDPPRPVLIPLEQALDAAGNVERYFKKYKKAKRGVEIAVGRLAQTDKEIAYLDSVLFQLDDVDDAQELDGIRRELEEERILPVSRQERSARENREAELPVRRLRTSEGLEVLCGKHNAGNDYILRHLARGNDLWFHAQGLPGSHVVLKAGPKEPRPASILEAAMIAAYFSRGRGSTAVPVDYTQVKNLHRPKGARPGFVTFTRQKTVTVRPDRERVEKLRA